MSDVRTTWRHFDFWLLGAVAILSIFSIAMIRSAIAGNITLAGYDQRQAIFANGGHLKGPKFRNEGGIPKK